MSIHKNKKYNVAIKLKALCAFNYNIKIIYDSCYLQVNDYITLSLVHTLISAIS